MSTVVSRVVLISGISFQRDSANNYHLKRKICFGQHLVRKYNSSQLEACGNMQLKTNATYKGIHSVSRGTVN